MVELCVILIKSSVFIYNNDNSINKNKYLIGQNFSGQKFYRTKFSAPTLNFGSFDRCKYLIGFLFPHAFNKQKFNMRFKIIL